MNKLIYTTIFLIELILIINANELSKTSTIGSNSSTQLNNSETNNVKQEIPVPESNIKE